VSGDTAVDPSEEHPVTVTPDLVHYRGYIADSARWRRVSLRSDDVVITVPSKSGTTWTQTLVALLLFDGVPE
jgi:aryl sulfotransferase